MPKSFYLGNRIFILQHTTTRLDVPNLKMSLVRFNRRVAHNLLKSRRCFATKSLTNEDEYTSTPQYPPILDLSYVKVKERKNESYYEEVKAVKTVEEKQIKLNMPKYYGFKCYMFHENQIPYNNLQLVQHITRTHLIEQDNLPEYYNRINVDGVVEGLKGEIEEALLLEYGGYRKTHEINETELSKSEEENVISSAISSHINRALLNNLVGTVPHLGNTLVDIDPRIESFWFAGGMTPPQRIRNWRKSIEWLKDRENESTNRAIQYTGTPSLTLRSNLPLPPIVPYNEAENPNLEVPYFQYDPRVVGTYTEHRRAVNSPGFWPGESDQFGLVSYHRRGHMLDRPLVDPVEAKEVLHRQGMLASFSWLNAQANFLGFTTYNDITYPLVTQCVITNGQIWSFYVYQLNTMLVHSKHPKENPKRNICWATKDLKLFEDIKDGKVVGFNEDVLKTLIKFYANVPEDRIGVELRPYLSKQERVIADYQDDDKRRWLEKEYKFITSNRPRHRLSYEIYNWEKIYKIDHKTRPFEARRRPFELFTDPWKRTYDDRQAKYIPRKERPDLPRHKGRYAKEYFP